MTWMAMDPIWIIHNVGELADTAAQAWSSLGSRQNGIWREFTDAEATMLRLIAPAAWMETQEGDIHALEWYRQNRPRHPCVTGSTPPVDQ